MTPLEALEDIISNDGLINLIWKYIELRCICERLSICIDRMSDDSVTKNQYTNALYHATAVLLIVQVQIWSHVRHILTLEDILRVAINSAYEQLLSEYPVFWEQKLHFYYYQQNRERWLLYHDFALELRKRYDNLREKQWYLPV